MGSEPYVSQRTSKEPVLTVVQQRGVRPWCTFTSLYTRALTSILHSIVCGGDDTLTSGLAPDDPFAKSCWLALASQEQWMTMTHCEYAESVLSLTLTFKYKVLMHLVMPLLSWLAQAKAFHIKREQRGSLPFQPLHMCAFQPAR